MNADEAQLSGNVIHNALHLDFGDPEVEQEANLESRGSEVIQALGEMDIVDCSGNLQLDNDRVVDQKICKVLADDHAVIQNCNPLLLLSSQPGFAALVSKSVLVHFLEKAGTERVAHAKGTANDQLSHVIQFVYGH